MADRRKVRADLVCAAGLEAHLEQRDRQSGGVASLHPEPFEHAKPRNRRTTLRHYRHSGGMTRVSPYRGVDLRAVDAWIAGDERDVRPLDLTLGHRGREDRVRLV